MCDYSLHDVPSRPAKVGDRLISTRFRNSFTGGFAAINEPNVAICLLPGTELAFDAQVERERAFRFLRKRKMGHRVARFRQLDMDNPTTHHDALEFPDGATVLVTELSEGQVATVLQLPATGWNGTEERRTAEQISRRGSEALMRSNA